MTRAELSQVTGVRRISELSKTTVVVEFASGHVRPATPLEVKLWNLLKEMTG